MNLRGWLTDRRFLKPPRSRHALTRLLKGEPARALGFLHAHRIELFAARTPRPADVDLPSALLAIQRAHLGLPPR